MARFFKAADAVQAAVDIEKKGEEFYAGLAKAAASQPLRELFIHLAGEEKKHELTFSALLSRLADTELPAWSTEDEYAMYVGALVDSHSLFDAAGGARLAKGGSADEALRFAIAFEKDTLLFFMELKDLVPDAHQPAVQALIEEERKHIRQLSAML